jgi:cation diffusion facilitator CzcD-associated flavoprotein CzcO
VLAAGKEAAAKKKEADPAAAGSLDGASVGRLLRLPAAVHRAAAAGVDRLCVAAAGAHKGVQVAGAACVALGLAFVSPAAAQRAALLRATLAAAPDDAGRIARRQGAAEQRSQNTEREKNRRRTRRED